MKVVELFSGAGGMSAGLTRAGFDILAAYDSMADAVDTYRLNLGDHVQQRDLTDLLGIIPDVIALAPDMVAGGPPCQDYSAAGKRKEGANAKLTLAYAITIVSVRPEWFLMENVVQAATSRSWAEAKALLRKAGYGISESKIDFSFYGAPQARKRLIVVGRLGEQDGFLESEIAKAATPVRRTVRQAFSKTAAEFGSQDNVMRMAYVPILAKGHVFTRILRAGRAVRSIDEPYSTITRTSSEPISEKFRAKYEAHPKDSAPLAAAGELNQRFLSRIQGFPEGWEWSSKNKRRKMVMLANAVPPPAARMIGKVILERNSGKTSPEIEGRFLQWLVRGHQRKRATARNIKSNLGRARYILLGRTFADAIQEIATLEAAPGFGTLSTGTKSDLRQALRLYREYQESKVKRGKKVAVDDSVKEEGLRQRPQRGRRIDLKAMMADMKTTDFHSKQSVMPEDGDTYSYVMG